MLGDTRAVRLWYTGPGSILAFFVVLFLEFVMTPSMRRGVSKRGSARHFRKNVSRTRAANVMVGPMRGGIRI